MALQTSAKQYVVIDPKQKFNSPTDIYNRAANWTLAGLEKNKAYRLAAKDQKRILGFVVGRGQVVCDWDRQMAFNVIQVCFGTDSTYQNSFNLNNGVKNY